MFKLWATIVKDFRVLTRDKVGLVLMFVMPVILVLVITSIQFSTFELVNKNKISILFYNKDKGEVSIQLIQAIEKMGMFELSELSENLNERQINEAMRDKDVLLALVIPENFSAQIMEKADHVNEKALHDFGISEKHNTGAVESLLNTVTLYYHPVLQESYRRSIQGALRSALQIVETKQILQTLYFSLNEKPIPEEIENAIITNHTWINEIPVSRDGSKAIPNATQHNVPAWTIFAMFFIVTSLGNNVVKEKQSGSFVRLKTLPTNYVVALLSKMVVYLGVCLTQVLIIFSIGVWIFPLMGLPTLNLPADLMGLFIVSVICSACAISYAICVGVFVQTQEQANGFGAVSIVIWAAIGGILVPSFAMPESFQVLMRLSPLHWCLESYYGLFLEGGTLKDVMTDIIPLLAITAFILLIALAGLKRKNLI